MRVIVTGETENGTAIKISDQLVDALAPVTRSAGASFADVFCSDSIFTLPSDGSTQYGPALFPTEGGFRFWIFTIPAHTSPLEPGPATDAYIESVRAVNPEHAAKLSQNKDGMAFADTVEWVIILSGEVDYLLPDGQQFSLKQGDSLVQLGNKHRWRNIGDVPCVMAAAVIGAKRASS